MDNRTYAYVSDILGKLGKLLSSDYLYNTCKGSLRVLPKMMPIMPGMGAGDRPDMQEEKRRAALVVKYNFITFFGLVGVIRLCMFQWSNMALVFVSKLAFCPLVELRTVVLDRKNGLCVVLAL